MINLAAALFFTLALLASLVTLHMIVRTHWQEILLALAGEFGAEIRRSASPARALRRSAAPRHAAA